jgi:Glycosyl hydrolase family 26
VRLAALVPGTGRLRGSLAVGAIVACVVPLTACGGSGQGAGGGSAPVPLEPRDGTVYAGASTGAGPAADEQFASFLATAGQSSTAIVNQFSSHELSSFDWVLDDLRRRPGIGMISWWLSAPAYSPGTPGGTTASIAAGEADALILANASEVRAYGKPLFLRLNWEMNAYWFPWGAYDQAGAARPGNSHADYRNMWRRTVILFRGGTRAEVDARLAALGLPGLTTPDASVPATPNVAWVWNANYDDNPQIDDAFAYWPGDEYVDWVGVDWYGADSRSHADQADALPNAVYDRYSGPESTAQRPFMLGEWGVGDADRPDWASDMFDWIQARPKVKAQLYYNLPAGPGWLPLEDTPATLAVYRARVAGHLTQTADRRGGPSFRPVSPTA